MTNFQAFPDTAADLWVDRNNRAIWTFIRTYNETYSNGFWVNLATSGVMFNVMHYGATGNGVTDDTAALQATLNVANGVGGATVYLPPGTYLISSQLVIHSQTILRGAGMYASTIKAAAGYPTTNYLITNYAQTQGSGNDENIQLVDVTFNMNGSNQSGINADYGPCPAFTYTTDLLMERCQFINPYGFAGLVTGTSTNRYTYNVRPKMIDCVVNGTGQHSNDLFDFGCGADGYIRNCWFGNGGGVSVGNCKGFKIEGCTFADMAGSAPGLGLEGVVDCTVTDCRAYGNGGSGFTMIQWSEDANKLACSNVTFADCEAISNGSEGFQLYDSTDDNDYPCTGLSLNNCWAVSNQDSGFYISGVVGMNVNGGGCISNSQAGAGTVVAFNLVNQPSESSTASNTEIIINGFHWFDPQGSPTQEYGLDINQAETVQVTNCQFNQCTGATIRIDPLSASPASSLLILRSNQGYNPKGTISIGVPSSGTATAAQVVDTIYYVKANASGTTSVAVSGASSVSIAASATVPIFVPAGQTLTPTYTGGDPPTWTVQGL